MSETGIAYDDRDRPPSDAVGVVAYVGGPRDGVVEELGPRDPPAAIVVSESSEAGPGVYRRSVRCADDRALRYVWQPD